MPNGYSLSDALREADFPEGARVVAIFRIGPNKDYAKYQFDYWAWCQMGLGSAGKVSPETRIGQWLNGSKCL